LLPAALRATAAPLITFSCHRPQTVFCPPFSDRLGRCGALAAAAAFTWRKKSITHTGRTVAGHFCVSAVALTIIRSVKSNTND